MSYKKLEEYNDKYGNIPNELNSRFNYLLKTLNIKMKDVEKLKKSIKRINKIKYTTLEFVFYFIPQATPRPRYSRFSKVFYVKNALNYNELFREFVESCDDLDFKITTPCEFITKTYAPTPAGMNREDKLLSELELIKNISKPDWDNLGKTYSDMVQKHLILDDSLIYDGHVQKFYSAKPRIEITIRFMNDYDTNYNKTKVEKWSTFNE